jgi:NADH-quinone oxidoreductase subunit E
MVNWEFMDNQTPESATQLVDDLRSGVEVRSTRGPRICTWREAERVLAGFPDDRADEGPAAGPASLAGLEIARERGWTAPSHEASGQTGTPGGESAEAAAETADTQRAESETKVEESK